MFKVSVQGVVALGDHFVLQHYARSLVFTFHEAVFFFCITNFEKEKANTYLDTFHHSYCEKSSNRATWH